MAEGGDWGTVQKVPLLHSEGSHPLTLYPIETPFALDESWHGSWH
jgi:hypothetical protein